MKAVVVCLIGVVALGFGLWPKSPQDDPKAEIKKKHRDARYSDPLNKTNPISSMQTGQFRQSFVHVLDMTGYDSNETTEQRAAVRSKLQAEQAAKRKSIGCASTVVVFGRTGKGTGYITADDTALYTAYPFRITTVIRAPQSLGLNAGSQIEFTAPGGVAVIKPGRWAAVEHPTFPMLPPDADHLLFLKYDPESDDYYVYDPVGVYITYPDGRFVRADASKHEVYAKKFYLAREPKSLDEVIAEVKSMNCSQ